MTRALPGIRGFAVIALATLAPATRGQGWLDTARWYVPSTPGELLYVADVDGDGFEDAIWFRGTPGTPTYWTGFRVLFNDGAGDFAEGPLVPIAPTGKRFAPLTFEGLRRVADLTGDGQIDVVVVERLASTTLDVAVYVYPGQGGGQFGAPHIIPINGSVDGAVVGQADTDPASELALMVRDGASEQLAWWDFAGGSFQPGPTTTIPTTLSGPWVTRLAALDLEGDGDDDLVYGEISGNRLVSLHTSGLATATAQVLTLPVPAGTHVYPYVGDLGGDGVDDLLVIGGGSYQSTFRLIPVRNQAGFLVADPPQPFTGADAVWGDGFEVGDWDGDGDLDAIYYPWQEPAGTTEGIVAFFANDGANGFGAGPVAKSETVYNEAYAPVGVLDLDRDGHLDVVLPQSTLFGRGRFESTLTELTDPFYGAIPRVVTDQDDDGDLDFYLEVGTVMRNDGTGAVLGLTPVAPAPTGLVKRVASGIGDFDGDGRVDFLIPLATPSGMFTQSVFQEMRLYRDDGLGLFVDGGTAKLLSMEPYARALNVAFDLDGDGDTDLLDRSAAGGGFWPNHGLGTFAAFQQLFGPNAEPAAVADLDGDADPDVITHEYPQRAHVQVNQGSLSFAATLIHDDPSWIAPDSITLADLDLDGDLDLGFSNAFSEKVLLFQNHGAASFSLATTLSTSQTSANDPEMLHLAFDDVDGDGQLDLLAGAEGSTSSTPRRVVVFRGTGSFQFQPLRIYCGGAMGAPGDVDGDGDVDLTGRVLVRSRRFDGPADGVIQQIGQGTPGAGGATPLLGASGPLRPGSTSAALRVRRLVGGAAFVLMYGPNAAEVPGSLIPSATLYVGAPLFAIPLTAGGSSGVAGAGAVDVGLGPLLPSLVGLSIASQILGADATTPSGLSVSNGLVLTFGG